MVNTNYATSIYVKADCTFYMPYYPDGSENPDLYYNQYGSYCSIYFSGSQPVIQSSQSPTPTQIQSVQSAPMFNVKVNYAYVGQRTQYLTLPNTIQNETGPTNLNAASLYPSLICLNVTKASSASAVPCDAQIEVYQIQVRTDTGITENYIYTIGSNVNTSYSDTSQLSHLRPNIDNFTAAQNANRIEGYYIENSTIGQTISGTRIGSLGSYQSGPSNLGFWSAGQPNAITVSIQRLGYIVLNGSNASSFSSSPQTTATTQLSLEKVGNGFIYNTAVPQDKLQQIDPFSPPI